MAVVDEEYGRRQDHNTTVSTHYHYKYKQYGAEDIVSNHNDGHHHHHDTAHPLYNRSAQPVVFVLN